MVKKKIRLDDLVMELGLAKNLREAQGIIQTGKVLVNGKAVTKPGTAIDHESEIEIIEKQKYVSRGGVKLESGMEAFEVVVAGKICMDVGASTGGFTDLLLQNGAKKVYALDVGKGLLDWKLRNDPRVVVMEKVNARNLEAEMILEKISLATVDVSFISLTLILPALKNVLAENADVIALVKPQFELEPKFVKKGVVENAEMQLQAVEKIANFAAKIGLKGVAQTKAKIKGPKGNQEYFLYLQWKK